MTLFAVPVNRSFPLMTISMLRLAIRSFRGRALPELLGFQSVTDRAHDVVVILLRLSQFGLLGVLVEVVPPRDVGIGRHVIGDVVERGGSLAEVLVEQLDELGGLERVPAGGDCLFGRPLPGRDEVRSRRRAG